MEYFYIDGLLETFTHFKSLVKRLEMSKKKKNADLLFKVGVNEMAV